MAVKSYSKMPIAALLIFWTGGCIGVLIDLDHLIGPLFGLSPRFMHAPVMYCSLVAIGCVIAYIGGLIFRVVLRRLKNGD